MKLNKEKLTLVAWMLQLPFWPANNRMNLFAPFLCCYLNFIFGSHIGIDDLLRRHLFKHKKLYYFFLHRPRVYGFRNVYVYVLALSIYSVNKGVEWEFSFCSIVRQVDDVSTKVRNEKWLSSTVVFSIFFFFFVAFAYHEQISNVEGQKQFIVKNQSTLELEKINKTFQRRSLFKTIFYNGKLDFNLCENIWKKSWLEE